ncbi:MAG: hypothetical protein JW726_20195, partial [Anaerolineales bacterium]|nr:hypothetical protein [Anaerolineales bacterium]
MRDYILGGSTPTGRSKSYSYYVTKARPGGRHRRVRCEVVDSQIPDLLKGLVVDPELLPEIRRLYHEHLAEIRGPTTEERIREIRKLIGRLHNEEAALARLFAQGKLTEKNYDTLHEEWRSKLVQAEQEIERLSNGDQQYVDDLEMALVLLRYVDRVFERLEKKQQKRLLQILVKHIIIDTQGSIIECELNPPFKYLHALKQEAFPGKKEDGLLPFQSSPPDWNHLEPSKVGAEQFFEMLRFPQRKKY